MSTKKTVAVVFGSRAPEHDVSIITAISSIIEPLKLLGYKVVPIYIDKTGRWWTGDEFARIETYQNEKKLAHAMKRRNAIELNVNEGLTIIKGTKLGVQYTKIDIVFPATHGAFGEDGSLMGLLRMANVPFAGCDMEASVIAMNKILSKIIAMQNGIATPKFLYFSRRNFETNPAAVIKEINEGLKYPLFVKPPHLGSSIGITKVSKKSELENALEVAAHYDTQILVEEGVENLIEVTLPIIGNDELTTGLLERPLNRGEFFDFDTKYMNGGKKGKNSKAGGGKNGKLGAQGYSEIPAKLPAKLSVAAQNLATAMYHASGLSGIARIDMLIDEKTGVVYFNEINPLPGSLYVHNWARAGISNVELIKKILRLAEEKFAAEQKTATTFKTNFLKQF
ncbi:hypothetical protein FWF74_02560 [Candidatus Saccharibacteria bacterium]|nr:hypothetical protein [Candidatus Saccharibacteria bacterium]MCL1962697.1 hypothetical protein [Candidatus Saccharibacteria bacterium]